MKIDFELSTDLFLLGIQYSNCIAEDVETGEEFQANTLSFGFLFFTIDIHFLPNR